MHDLKSLRDQIDALRDGMRRRDKLDQIGPLIDRAESLDRERRTSIQAPR
jgi:seryl-tRNA synthetase